MQNLFSAVIVLLCAFSACPLSGQVLTRSLNAPRSGDVLNRRVMRYIFPGAAGQNAVWDFSEATELDEDLKETYTGCLDSVLTAATPHSAYNYRFIGDSLMCLGYTAPNLEVSYLRPQLSMHYPLAYGDSIPSMHYGEGMYSHKLYMAVYGDSWCKADGDGVIVLPEGDTLRHVLRVHEHALLGQRLSPGCGILSLGDSTVLSSDTILSRLSTDTVTWTMDSYRWYAAGYRYPVFETIETEIVREGQSFPNSRSTYYLPAYEQAYLESDPENEELRELLAQAWLRQEETYTKELADGSSSDAANLPFSYSPSFSGDGSRLDMDFSFEGDYEVQFQLSTVQGFLLARTPKRSVSAGTVRETFDLSSARANVYMLSVMVDGKIYSNVISRY